MSQIKKKRIKRDIRTVNKDDRILFPWAYGDRQSALIDERRVIYRHTKRGLIRGMIYPNEHVWQYCVYGPYNDEFNFGQSDNVATKELAIEIADKKLKSFGFILLTNKHRCLL